MRRIAIGLSVVLAFAFVARPADAQVAIDLGVKGGVSISEPDVEDATDIASRTGLVAGGFATFRIGDYLFIQPEVLYSAKGAEEEGGDLVQEQDFLEVPVLLGAEFELQGSPIMPRIFAGPAVAFELKCDISNGTSESCEDFGINLKSTDFGIVFGAGVGFALENVKIIVDGRYDLGLADLNDEPDDTQSFKNRAWQFMAGVAFPIGGGM